MGHFISEGPIPSLVFTGLSGKYLGICNYFHLPFLFSQLSRLDAFPGKLKVTLILEVL